MGIGDRGLGIGKTQNPKSQTPNPKPQTPSPKPQTPNPKPQTPSPIYCSPMSHVPSPGDESAMGRTYALVIVTQIAVTIALWWLARFFA